MPVILSLTVKSSRSFASKQSFLNLVSCSVRCSYAYIIVTLSVAESVKCKIQCDLMTSPNMRFYGVTLYAILWRHVICDLTTSRNMLDLKTSRNMRSDNVSILNATSLK